MVFSAGSKYSAGPVAKITTTPQTLTAADSGKIFQVAVADCVFNLPATEEGLNFKFIVTTISATTGCLISPKSTDSINGHNDDKDLINTAATDQVGDWVEFYGDGTDGWLAQTGSYGNGTSAASWAIETP